MGLFNTWKYTSSSTIFFETASIKTPVLPIDWITIMQEWMPDLDFPSTSTILPLLGWRVLRNLQEYFVAKEEAAKSQQFTPSYETDQHIVETLPELTETDLTNAQSEDHNILTAIEKHHNTWEHASYLYETMKDIIPSPVVTTITPDDTLPLNITPSTSLMRQVG
eukprot:GHVS01075474.1.p1 GENE.GHVS01075474.1~~GHVS01075474.1.p1  ORF type:complete len:165 (+),score=18.78 GHVS01075474.1:118-612(+)